MYKISVIIPVFNSEKYLKKCLDSVLSQTLNDIEIILINDGSTDNSLEIIKNYASKHSNITYKSILNSGQAVARNLGIEMATGEFLCFVDSDDYIEVNMLKTLYEAGIKNKSDIILCDYLEDYERKSIYKKSLYINEENIIKNYIVCVAGPCSKIIKTELIKKNNLKFLENNIYEDLAMIPTIALYTNNISYCPNPLYHYVIRTNSTMQQTSYNRNLESIFNVMNYLYDIFNQKGYDEELEFLYINHLLYSGIGRFLKYKNTNEIILRIINIINIRFPHWKYNKYFKKQNKIYKLTCYIFMRNKKMEIALYKLFRRII